MRLQNYLIEEIKKGQWNIYRENFLKTKGVNRTIDLSTTDRVKLGADYTEYLNSMSDKELKAVRKKEMKDKEREWIRIAKKTGYDNRNVVQKFIDFIRL